jgi:hypothetical protein
MYLLFGALSPPSAPSHWPFFPYTAVIATLPLGDILQIKEYFQHPEILFFKKVI